MIGSSSGAMQKTKMREKKFDIENENKRWTKISSTREVSEPSLRSLLHEIGFRVDFVSICILLNEADRRWRRSSSRKARASESDLVVSRFIYAFHVCYVYQPFADPWYPVSRLKGTWQE